MTEADKKKMEDLVNMARSMKGIAERQNTPYHDKKVAEFATQAIAEYGEVKAYIMNLVAENKDLFFDFGNFRIDNGGLGYSFFPNDNVVHTCGKYLNIAVHIDQSGVGKTWRGNVGGLYAEVDPAAVRVVGVWAYTSDTNDVNYRVTSAWALAGGGGHVQFDLSGVHDAQTWQNIYNYATWTRAKCRFLWDSGIDAVKSCGENFRAKSNKAEATHKALSAVGVYVRVSGV